MFGFLVLVYKCKALPTLEQHCNVYFIGFISSFFSSRCCSVFLYTVSFLLLTVMTCICLIPPPPSPFFQCVLISNVCGFADGFMKKTSGQKKETGKDSVVFRDGWWSVWLVITIVSFWHEYVCKDTNVQCGRWEHFKIEKQNKKNVDLINISWKGPVFLLSLTSVWFSIHVTHTDTHTYYWFINRH